MVRWCQITMLSDEEKKAIDLLKNIDKQKCVMLECPVVKNNIERQLKIIELNKLIKKQSKEIEELKASNIMTHNKSTNTEKAKIFDVINNSLDRYIEKKFPVTITKEELEKRWKE